MASGKTKAAKPGLKEKGRSSTNGRRKDFAEKATNDIDLFRDEFKKTHGDIRAFIAAMEGHQSAASQPCVLLLHKLDEAIATGSVAEVNESDAIYVDMLLLALPSREKWLLYIRFITKADAMKKALRADAPNDLIEHVLYNGQVSGRSREEMAIYLKERATPAQVLILGEDDERKENAARLSSSKESAFLFMQVADAAIPMAFASGAKMGLKIDNPEDVLPINMHCRTIKAIAHGFANANIACGGACPPKVFDALVDLCATGQTEAATMIIRGIATLCGDGDPDEYVC